MFNAVIQIVLINGYYKKDLWPILQFFLDIVSKFFFFFGYLYIANIYKILHFKQYDYLSYINKVIGIVLNYDTILLFLHNNP